MVDIITDPDNSGHDSNFIFNNLTERRWREPILSAGELADNLRSTRTGRSCTIARNPTLMRLYDGSDGMPIRADVGYWPLSR
jgi:hypothetical protein